MGVFARVGAWVRRGCEVFLGCGVVWCGVVYAMR